MPNKINGLEINQDLAFQKKEWKVQKVGMYIILFLIIVSIAGFFGTGPVSYTEEGVEGGDIYAEYQRYTRRHAPNELRLKIGSNALKSDSVIISFDEAYIAEIQITSISPIPLKTYYSPGKVNYLFSLKDNVSSATIVYYFSPESTGKLNSAITINNGSSVNFSQLVYP